MEASINIQLKVKGQMKNNEEGYANLILIESAPELLKTLIDIRDMLWHKDSFTNEDEISLCEIAIKKALG